MQLVELDKVYYQKAYQLLKAEFPICDIRTYDTYIDFLEKGIYHIYGILAENEVLGTCLVIDLDDYVFIENLAVTSQHQSKGIGGFIIDELSSLLNKPLVLEVEEDDKMQDRVRFYNRHAFELYNDAFYYLPLINEEPNLNKMYLMCQESLNSDKYQKICQKIFDKVYQQKSE